MAIFRDLSQKKDSSDRSAGDRARNRELVRESIKENLPDIITEEVIFETDGKKKIKVPITFVKEWRFVYGGNQDGVGQGEGLEPGDVIGSTDETGDKSKPGEGGNQSGEIIFEEAEIDLDELIDLMFEDLHLPFLEQKKLHEVEVESESKWEGLSQRGIEPRLDLEQSFIEKLRRRKMLEARLDEATKNDPAEALRIQEELNKNPFPFTEEDLRYHRITIKTREESNAVVFFIMDISGSMDKTKRYLAKGFLFLLYYFLKKKFRRVEKVFIAHHTEAFQVPENDFFNLSDSGGTNISSGPLKASGLIRALYPLELWNIYVVHCSDGENFSVDNDKAIKAFQDLVAMANLIGFVEIKPEGDWSTIGDKLETAIDSPHFQLIKIKNKKQVGPRFIEFMNCDKKYSDR